MTVDEAKVAYHNVVVGYFGKVPPAEYERLKANAKRRLEQAIAAVQ